MNVNNFGVIFVQSTGYDLTGFSTLEITFVKPSGAVLTVANPAVSAPEVDIETVVGLMPSGTYSQYIFVEGDVDEVGLWSVRTTFDDGSQRLTSDIATFTIFP